jgi:glycosyltransferase involved in cell wall biosynthesis
MQGKKMLDIKQRCKILYIVSTLKRSGPTNQLFNLIKYLDRGNFEPQVITLSPEPTDSRWDDFVGLGVELDTLALSRIKGLFLAKRQLKKKIKRIKPDIIHTQGIRADSLMATVKPGCPWFLTVRNYPRHDYSMKFGTIQGRIMAHKHISVMRKCFHVIACSKNISQLLNRHKIMAQSIQNGVELQKDSSQKAAKVANLPKPVFISVGSLIERKNMRFVIESFNQYAKNKSGSLVILGDGPQMQELSRLATERVCLLGNVTNIADYLFFSDYYISASYSEGLPNTALEALTSGLPLLLSDIPAHLEIKNESKHACVLFSLDEGPMVLADKMNRLDSLFADKAREDALRASREVFSAEIMSKKYQKLYKKLSEYQKIDSAKRFGNRYNHVERFFARILAVSPFVKKLAKLSYERIIYILKKEKYKYKTDKKIMCFSRDDFDSFFGYYDKSPASVEGYLLCHLAQNNTIAKPAPNRSISVALFDNKGEFIYQIPTYAYNWQQGARTHWLNEELFIFNDFDYLKRRYIARVFSKTQRKKVKRFDRPVQDSYKTEYILSVNYRRLAALRPDYGYCNLTPLSKRELKDYRNDGIWKVDYQTGQNFLLYSLDQIYSKFLKDEFRNATHYVNHLMISPSGKEFVFLHRYYIGRRRFERLMLGDIKGRSLKLLSDYGMVSHYCWIDETTILGYLRGSKKRNGYFLINVISGKFVSVAKGALDNYGDGHPHVYGDWFVTDTYPDKARMQYLLLCNWKTGDIKKLGEFFHGFKYRGESRCDLHPRFSPDGKNIFFDSVFEGKRKLYKMDLEL